MSEKAFAYWAPDTAGGEARAGIAAKWMKPVSWQVPVVEKKQIKGVIW